MRVLVIAPVAMDESGLANRATQADQFAASTGSEFEFRAVAVGPLSYDTHQDWLLAEIGTLHAGARAASEGFDAVCVDTLSDAGVNALRAVLDIPVVGAGQAAYLLARLLGRRFSVLGQWKPWIPIYERGLVEHGVRDACVSIRTVESRPDLENLLNGKEELFPLMAAEARKCVDDGADVIVLGSTTMHQAHRYLTEHVQVPVIDPGPASYALAHSLHVLGEAGHSRVAYTRADAELPLLDAIVAGGVEARRQPTQKGGN
jgi:allantoin racemase